MHERTDKNTPFFDDDKIILHYVRFEADAHGFLIMSMLEEILETVLP